MTATLLASDDPRLQSFRDAWDMGLYARYYWPRATWLHDVESLLRELHPQANSDSLTYTARSLAPFPLALPGVP